MVSNGCKRLLQRGVGYALALTIAYGAHPGLAMAADMAMPVPAPAAAGPQEKGDPNIGKMYFTGEKRFTNGGPPCMSCHSAGVGALDGGVLGPNLTKVYADPSKNPLVNSAWINASSIPVMGPVFSNRPVTDVEVEQLRAFFEQTSKKEKTDPPTGTFTIIGIAGTIGILIFFSIVWSGRYSNRNKATAHDALWRNYGGKGGR